MYPVHKMPADHLSVLEKKTSHSTKYLLLVQGQNTWVEATIWQLTWRMSMTNVPSSINIHTYVIARIQCLALDFHLRHLGGETRLVLPSGGPMNNSVSTSEFSLVSVDCSFSPWSSFDSFRGCRPCWKCEV